jgi:hypothetical protein
MVIDANKGREVKDMDRWEELLAWIVVQGGSFSTDETGAWFLVLDEDDPNVRVVAVTRRPIDLNEYVQLLAALTQMGLVWPPAWRGQLN